MVHKRTKHIEIDCHFIRDKIKSGLIHVVDVPTHDQVADFLIKRLSQAQHSYLLSQLGVLNIIHPTAWGGVLQYVY